MATRETVEYSLDEIVVKIKALFRSSEKAHV
jgi:hypothetical protein